METITRSIYELEGGPVDSPFLTADFNTRGQEYILTLRGHQPEKMVEAAQILMENVNNGTGSIDLCIVLATMTFDPNKFGVRTNP